jgi:hypothetical protein
VQTATINVAGDLAMAFDITPFNETPNALGSDQPLFDANNEDDVIYGGLGPDFLHGASGDDAMTGAEALQVSYSQLLDDNGNPIGLIKSDFNHPFNPGDVLHFGADTNAWHSNHHVAGRLGEFLLYDEYDPRREIQFNADGTLWKGTTQTGLQWFLNNDPADGDPVTACVAVDNQGNCTSTVTNMPSDGNDAIFGDLGNDWMVGGTGQDTLWGGWGNDLLNADDTLLTNNAQNDLPDGVNSSYQDRAYGGAGLDILIGNTGGDRLIDWVGEFNTYLVPFAPFGIATVSRQVEPQLPEFLYALSHSQGADPTRATDTGNDPARNGEPDGEIGLITQHDHGLWQQQTGGPTDPQAGNIPGGRRDTLRGSDFNDGSMQGFAVDSGSWTVVNGQLQVSAASLGQDAASVYYVDKYLPVFYEIQATLAAQKPTAGWNANSYVIVDYWSPTDFKFAGIDISLNKMVIGHRDASGWHVDSQAPFTSSLRSDTLYQVLVDVNGTNIQVSVNGSQSFNYTYGARTVCDSSGGSCMSFGLNKGFVGFGSNDSRGVLDNISVSTVSQGSTLDTTEYFEDGTPDQFTGYAAGTWAESGGRYVGSAAAGGYALQTAAYGASIQPTSAVTLDATVRATGSGGIAFDAYAANDFKFAALDIAGQRVVVGHVDPRRGWVVQGSFAVSLVAGVDYVLDVALKDTVATVSLNGNVLGSWLFNAAVTDGATGVVTGGGTTSIDRIQFKTDDPAFVGAAPQPAEIRVGNASAVEGNSGQTAVTVTLSLTAPVTAATSVTWTTVDGTARAGSDYVGVSSGVATFAAGSSTATVTVYLLGDTVYEPDETFGVRLTSWGSFNLAVPQGTVTVANDDPVPLTISIGNATVTEGDRNTSTVSIPVTLSSASATTVTVVASTVSGTAVAGSDFVAKTVTLTFNPGTTTLYVQVAVIGDKVKEPTETFTVALSSPTGGASIATGTGVVTIVDNDGAILANSAAATTAAGVRPLTPDALLPVVAQAKAMWLSVLPSADFGGYTIRIGDLPGLQLGWTDGSLTTIDATAAGWGWSVMYPGDDGSHMDLLAAVEHELGHALGLSHDDADRFSVMTPTLDAAPSAPPARAVPAPARPLPTAVAPLPVLVTLGRANWIAAPPRPFVLSHLTVRKLRPALPAKPKTRRHS